MTVEVPTVEADVEGTGAAVPVVAVEELTLAADDGVTPSTAVITVPAADGVEVVLTAAENVKGVEVVAVLFIVDSWVDAVSVVVAEGRALDVDDGVAALVNDVEVALATAEEAWSVELIAELTISAGVSFIVDSGPDADEGETVDDTEVEVLGLIVDSDVGTRCVVMLAESVVVLVELAASDDVRTRLEVVARMVVSDCVDVIWQRVSFTGLSSGQLAGGS